jgi:hypothetical protein
MRKVKIVELFKTLEVSDRYTDCKHCNYMGCTWRLEKYPLMGHWMWTLSVILDKLYTLVNMYGHYRSLKRYLTRLDYSKIDDIQVEGIDTRDYPDFCDAYVSYATYKGKEMTESQLERLNENSSFVYECVLEYLY